MTKMPIDTISTSGRYRKDAGDIQPLADSIERVGLLHPIVVTPDGDLIAGFRRLVACATLGWGEIPVTVAASLQDASARLEAERDENTCRLDMSPSEKVALGRALEVLERPKAAQRKSAGRPSPKLGEGRVDDIVGKAVGLSRESYRLAKHVVDAATEGEAGAGEALALMDETCKVSPAYERVAEARKRRARPKRKRPASASLSTDRGQEQALANRRRLVDLISAVRGYAEGADHLRIEHIYAVGDADELDQLIQEFGSALKSLRAFKSKLERSRRK